MIDDVIVLSDVIAEPSTQLIDSSINVDFTIQQTVVCSMY